MHEDDIVSAPFILQLANKLDNAVSNADREPLNVMVQVHSATIGLHPLRSDMACMEGTLCSKRWWPKKCFMIDPATRVLQVNTSGEESKFGVQPEEAPGLAQHIQQQCKNLRFRGLMTIGKRYVRGVCHLR